MGSKSKNSITLDRENHQYFTDGQPVEFSVSEVLRESGICPPYPPEAADNVERARELGTATHEWCDAVDRGVGRAKICKYLEGSGLEGYVGAYAGWWAKYVPNWKHIEQPFHREGCAGTPDRVGSLVFHGELIDAIVDIKTPKRAAPHWQLQLTAYAWLTHHPEYRLFTLWLHQDASFDLIPYIGDTQTWESALRVARWKKDHKAR